MPQGENTSGDFNSAGTTIGAIDIPGTNMDDALRGLYFEDLSDGDALNAIRRLVPQGGMSSVLQFITLLSNLDAQRLENLLSDLDEHTGSSLSTYLDLEKVREQTRYNAFDAWFAEMSRTNFAGELRVLDAELDMHKKATGWVAWVKGIFGAIGAVIEGAHQMGMDIDPELLNVARDLQAEASSGAWANFENDISQRRELLTSGQEAFERDVRREFSTVGAVGEFGDVATRNEQLGNGLSADGLRNFNQATEFLRRMMQGFLAGDGGYDRGSIGAAPVVN